MREKKWTTFISMEPGSGVGDGQPLLCGKECGDKSENDTTTAVVAAAAAIRWRRVNH